MRDPDELEQEARRHLDPAVFDFIAGGAGDETAIASNRSAWQALRLRPHVLRDVSAACAASTVLGTPITVPVVVAPMGQHAIAHHDGERASARAAADEGVVFTASTFSTASLEEIAAVAPGAPRWFQSYVLRDRGIVRDLLERAARSEYRAIVLTVDAPVPGDRWRDRRHGYRLPTSGLRLANLPADRGGPVAYASDLEQALTPDLLSWMAGLSTLPIVVKGVLRGDDARVCVAAGARAVVVSNHGGRQLDGAVSTADALAEVVAAVPGSIEVYVDGGVRTGTDVLRALALGARAVLVGRPVLWGLATGGYDGVCQVIAELRSDVERAMALSGVSSPAAVPADLLAVPRWRGKEQC